LRPVGLFELSSSENLPSTVELRVGDVLSVSAIGVLGKFEGGAIEILGPLTIGTLSKAGPILPEGGPNHMLLIARKKGTVEFQLVFGTVWGPRRNASLSIEVDD
jgi:hypothetical protein